VCGASTRYYPAYARMCSQISCVGSARTVGKSKMPSSRLVRRENAGSNRLQYPCWGEESSMRIDVYVSAAKFFRQRHPKLVRNEDKIFAFQHSPTKSIKAQDHSE
jgi:hypothetical protein